MACPIIGNSALTSIPVLQVYDITDKQTLQQVQKWVKELQAMVRPATAPLSSKSYSLRSMHHAACRAPSPTCHDTCLRALGWHSSTVKA